MWELTTGGYGARVVMILYSIFETCYGQVASFFERGIRKTARLLQVFSAAGRGIVALPLNIKGMGAKWEKSKVEQQKKTRWKNRHKKSKSSTHPVARLTHSVVGS